MGRVGAEAWQRQLGSNDQLHAKLAEADRYRVSSSFPEYVRGFGIGDLGQLTRNEVRAIVAARNLDSFIEYLQIPFADRRQAEAHLEYDAERPKTSLGISIREVLSPAPSGDGGLNPLRDPEDIPFAVPEDLMLRRRAPDEFLRRLAEGELLKVTWTDEEESPSDRPDAPPPEELPDREPGLTGYLLLDASQSMSSGGEAKPAVARGLALALAKRLCEGGDICVGELFRERLSNPFLGELGQIAAVLLRHPHQGMTNLQANLDRLARRLNDAGGRVDILLITDGLARLDHNPLRGAHLHTVLVGESTEGTDRFGREERERSRRMLSDWSDHFVRFEHEEIRELVVLDRPDLLSLREALADVDAEFTDSVTEPRLSRLQNRVARVEELATDYRAHDPEMDGEVALLAAEASRLRRLVGSAVAAQKSAENAEPLHPRDRQSAAILERLDPTIEITSVEIGWDDDPDSGESMSLWEAIRAWIRSVRSRRRRKAI